MTSPTEPRTPRLYHAASDSAFTALGGFLLLLAAMATLLVASTTAGLLGATPLVALAAGELALLIVPIAAAVQTGRGFGALGLRRTSPVYMASAVLIGVSSWYLNLRLIGLVEMPEHHIDWLERLARDDAQVAPMLLVLAVLPALCEEFVFRGVLVQALATRLVPVAAVALSAALFAAYHLSLAQLIPTFTLGIVFATVTLRARSIVPTIVAHLLNNAFALHADRWEWLGAHPTPVLAVAAVAFLAGIALAFVPASPASLPSARARYKGDP